MKRQVRWQIGGISLLLLGTCGAHADVTSIGGSARAFVQEIVSGMNADSDEASDQFPGTAENLPLQVVAHLRADQGEEAAASAASQFADPTELDQANPEEFAINLAASSVSAQTRYRVEAESQELRGVRFSSADLNGAAPGVQVQVQGRLFIDGALTLFAIADGRDMTGARVALEVLVEKVAEGQEDLTVFRGNVALLGSDGTVNVARDGDFPVDALVLSDLSDFAADFGELHLLIIPDLTIDYTYMAAPDEEFTLRATVRVEAENLGDQMGVAAVIGAPTDALAEVVTATQGETATTKLLGAIQKERDAPSGLPAFPEFPAGGGLSLCGPVGFGSLLLLAGGLTGCWNRRRTGRRHADVSAGGAPIA